MKAMIKHIKKLILLLVTLALALTCGCTGEEDGTMNPVGDNVPAEGGVLNLAGYEPDTLNPLCTKFAGVADYMYLAYESLFVVNEDLTVRGVLAESYKTKEKNKVYVISLKKNVKFHDGSAFNADDVIATFEYLQLYETNHSDALRNVASYTATDKHTIEIVLKEPRVNFLTNLDFPILASGLKMEDFTVPNTSYKMNGTGRYRFKGIRAYESLILEKNPSWHSTQKVYIPEVCIRFVNTKDAVAYAFDSGETDMVTTDYGRWGEFSYGIKSDTYEVTTTKYIFVGLNTKNSAFSDVNLRKRLAGIIDKNHIVDSVMFSHGAVADTPISSKAYFYRNDGDEGEKVTGKITNLRLSTYILFNEESTIKENIAKYLKTVLEDAGIKVELTKVSFETYMDKIASGDYQIYIGEVELGRDSDLRFMFSPAPVTAPPVSEGDGTPAVEDASAVIEAPAPQYGIRVCDFSSEPLDDIIVNINTAKDAETAKVAYNNLRVLYRDNAFQIPLLHVNDALFVSKRIKGKVNPNLTSFFADIGEIYITNKK